MKKLAAASAVLIATALTITVAAQETLSKEGITVSRSEARKTQPAPPQNFTGEVSVTTLFEAKAPSRSGASLVTFQPGARTAWHTHPLGQSLVATEGVGWVGYWEGKTQEFHKGDVVRIPAGVKHWHGASSTAAMSHIAIQESTEGGPVTWMEKVSDEQYRKDAPAKGGK